MKYGLARIAAHRTPLFSIEEAALHSRIDVFDPLQIQRLINTAIIRAEDALYLSFIDQSFKLVLENFPSMSDPIADGEDGMTSPLRFGYSGGHKRFPLRIQFPIGNAKSITHIKYYDTDDVLQTMDAADYAMSEVVQPPYVIPKSGSWPAVSDKMPNAVTIQFVAGFGTSPTTVPDTIIAACKMIFGHLYENREDVTPGLGAPNPAVLPRNSDWLLALHRWR